MNKNRLFVGFDFRPLGLSLERLPKKGFVNECIYFEFFFRCIAICFAAVPINKDLHCHLYYTKVVE